jgi:hypothetical protein
VEAKESRRTKLIEIGNEKRSENVSQDIFDKVTVDSTGTYLSESGLSREHLPYGSPETVQDPKAWAISIHVQGPRHEKPWPSEFWKGNSGLLLLHFASQVGTIWW